MEPNYAACLELSIAMPGFFSSPSFPASGESGGGGAIKELDINQAPSGREELEEFMEEEDDDESPAAVRRKKLRLSKQQSRLLEESFVLNHNLNPKEKEALAMELKLKPRQVEVWFQNRRARSKMKQTEMECEYLKKWFATLTEQNRRLQKEVAELRAMKVAPASPICLHPQPPAATQLTMCPRCECVTTAALLEKGPAAAASKMSLLQSRQVQPSATCMP